MKIAEILVKIADVSYPYVFGMGAMMTYENLMSESFAGVDMSKLSVTQTNVLHYACLCNGGAEFRMGFADFVRHLNDPECAKALRLALENELKRWYSLNQKESEDAPRDDEDEKKN